MTLYLAEIFIGALNAALISELNSARMKVVCTLYKMENNRVCFELCTFPVFWGASSSKYQVLVDPLVN